MSDYQPNADWTPHCYEAGYLHQEYEFYGGSYPQECGPIYYNAGISSPSHSVSSYSDSASSDNYDDFDLDFLIGLNENVRPDEILEATPNDLHDAWEMGYTYNPDDKFNSLQLSLQQPSDRLPPINEIAWQAGPAGGHCPSPYMQPDPEAMMTRPSDVKYEPDSPAKFKKTHQPSIPIRPRRTNKRAKGHLWEFVLELLKNDKHNPKVVKWEDRKRGIFRFMDSKEASRLWGERKGNKKMTYEKMSRAMRYTRGVGYFRHVPKRPDSPKRLMFAFGDFATGWQSDA